MRINIAHQNITEPILIARYRGDRTKLLPPSEFTLHQTLEILPCIPVCQFAMSQMALRTMIMDLVRLHFLGNVD
jgi:hypothetical protein